MGRCRVGMQTGSTLTLHRVRDWQERARELRA